jgi:ribosomal protein S18 acetylase RimI-like enzyme
MACDLLHHDEWLTGMLDCPAFHLTGSVKSLGAQDLPRERAFVDAKVAVTRIDELRYLQELGFRVVDTNVQLCRKPEPLQSDMEMCRFAVPGDERWVRDIAASSFAVSRFHLDTKIPKKTADQIKANWAGNFFNGSRGDWMVVAKDQNGLAGFLQILRHGDEAIQIDLIAVAEKARGRGLGQAMIGFASQFCLERPAGMWVGTQIANIHSLNFYSALGFSFVSATYVLHLHTKGSQ